ncbi:MAG: type transporter [Myxococcales bacterium]|nr:type transporter [Myxococcales bacterium]
MQPASIIFRRELGAYVRSPIGWIVVAAFMLASGILFQAYAMAGEQLSAVVLEKFFWGTSGVTMIIAVILSFRLIAEERQNASIVLLNTSPVRDTSIIIGKFFAALAFLALMLALSVYIPLMIKVNGKVSGVQILVGYLGLLLLGGTVLAIGLFASSMTKSQLIAAIIAALITALMVILFPIAKRLDAPLREVLQEVDLWWIHFQNGFMRGVLNLKDVVFYVAVTYFFLLLSVKALEAKRWQ